MPPDGWSTYKRLLGYLRPYWILFLASWAAFLLASGAEVYFLRLFGQLVDGWAERGAQLALFIPLAMLVAVLVRGLGELTGEALLGHVSFSIVHNLRVALFEQLLHLPSAFFAAAAPGRLVSRMTHNVAQLRDAATVALKSIIQDGGKVAVYLAGMLYLSWTLSLVFVAAVPVAAAVVVAASRRFRRIARRIQEAMGDLSQVTSEAVSGHREVRIFGGQQRELQRFGRASRNNRRQNLKLVVAKAASTQLVQILVVAAIAALIALLSRPNVAQGLSTGSLVSFLGLAGMLVRPIRRLTEVNARLQTGLAAAEDIFAQLDAQAESDEGTLEVERVCGRIELRNVRFGYDGGAGPVLRDIDLSMEPGQTLALVGRSGSGKSTLASLIPRFCEAQRGEVLIDGIPVQAYRRDSLRRQIALVTQQVTLFNDTLGANIAYGALAGADAEAIRQAIRCAQAEDFIDRLPEGLDTPVGEDGLMLSGGQRQRVAIARALLKDAPILILDEATSALDSESEGRIRAALEQAMRGRTTLVIAHRLSTVQKADRIVVMDDGRIVETGDHASLLAKGGIYAGLHRAQFEDGTTAGFGAGAQERGCAAEHEG